MTDAYIAVKDDCIPVRKAAKLFSVPETSLRRRVNGTVGIDCVRSGPDPLFSIEQEAKLVDHVKLLAKVGYGYSRGELCNLATEFAVDLGVKSIQVVNMKHRQSCICRRLFTFSDGSR